MKRKGIMKKRKLIAMLHVKSIRFYGNFRIMYIYAGIGCQLFGICGFAVCRGPLSKDGMIANSTIIPRIKQA
jgi:hypothetical protein